MAGAAVTGQHKSVLLLGPENKSTEDACMRMLSVAEPEETHLLAVSSDRSPDEWLAGWRAVNGTLPAEAGIIAVGDRTRSAATTSVATPGAGRVTIDTVPEPSDLTGIGMRLGAYLDAWSESDLTPVACFDSISSLLFHAPEERVFRFLHITTSRLRDAGAYAHFHFDPEVHDEETVNLIRSLYDAVVHVDDEGSVSFE